MMFLLGIFIIIVVLFYLGKISEDNQKKKSQQKEIEDKPKKELNFIIQYIYDSYPYFKHDFPNINIQSHKEIIKEYNDNLDRKFVHIPFVSNNYNFEIRVISNEVIKYKIYKTVVELLNEDIILLKYSHDISYIEPEYDDLDRTKQKFSDSYYKIETNDLFLPQNILIKDALLEGLNNFILEKKRLAIERQRVKNLELQKKQEEEILHNKEIFDKFKNN